MGKSFMSLNIKRVIMYSFLGLLLIFFIQFSFVFLSTGVSMPCHPNDGYCWEGQSDKIQREYLN